jgi:hypothetical protein
MNLRTRILSVGSVLVRPCAQLRVDLRAFREHFSAKVRLDSRCDANKRHYWECHRKKEFAKTKNKITSTELN